MTLEQFETLVLSQRPASAPWTPVTDYSFEARKAVEGEHPRLILETFQPQHIIDVGCGFNYLARLINERAGWTIACGADKDNPEADYSYDVTQALAKYRRADLVICREVLEHLTLLQIRQAVTNLCRLAIRYVYVTTRFANAPQSLLDVDTADDLDPTHITLLNQDFLRVLFVLEGFRRRPDLEARLDWQHKGRVLVYERA